MHQRNGPGPGSWLAGSTSSRSRCRWGRDELRAGRRAARREADRQRGHVGRAAAEKVARSPSHGEDVRSFCHGSAARGRVFPFFRRRQTVCLCRVSARIAIRVPTKLCLLVFQPLKSRQSMFVSLSRQRGATFVWPALFARKPSQCASPACIHGGRSTPVEPRQGLPTIARSCTPWRAACLSPRCNHCCSPHHGGHAFSCARQHRAGGSDTLVGTCT